ncbi:Nitrogen fixation protein RnfD [Limihaloglobus sulfuriphilus]|uniref:Ion-translocating oxidoreductase complex subunit D n=1 Tax=Limihaloglobus sulfuriphilus TaxID=1851148 RepID=A0A1Q2MD17_9BACT|nr:RnfABCDGE type electron transport complex subunit D [Limihaloglobus sulfuriphilus]AQQ70585.1 Nitrogen fixation protein RnfD [Limihaloglobus sulfuriphilus]
MSETNKLIVSPAPHISRPLTTRQVMLDVIIALVPAMAAGLFFFREKAAILILTAVLACVISEYLCCLIRKQKSTIGDLSAVVTGVILAFSVSPNLPPAYIVIGSVFCIVIGKMVFGGLGDNPFNPAMLGRAFMTACFGMAMTTWSVPAVVPSQQPKIGAANSYVTGQSGLDEDETLDVITQATPLAWVKEAVKTRNLEDASKIVKAGIANSQLKAVFWGYTGGCLGETSAFALLLGGAYLLIRRTITWIVPVFVIGSAFVFAEIAYLVDSSAFVNPLVHIAGGGMLMAAFFIATDPVTNPVTRKGRMVFGAGVGLLIMLIRVFGAYPEGVMYAVLIMNALSPLIDRMCKRKPYGGEPNAK